MCLLAVLLIACEKEFIVQLTDGRSVNKAWSGHFPGQDLRPAQFLFPYSTIDC